MHDDQTVQRFIERHAQGWTYARLMSPVQAKQGWHSEFTIATRDFGKQKVKKK